MQILKILDLAKLKLNMTKLLWRLWRPSSLQSPLPITFDQGEYFKAAVVISYLDQQAGPIAPVGGIILVRKPCYTLFEIIVDPAGGWIADHHHGCSCLPSKRLFSNLE